MKRRKVWIYTGLAEEKWHTRQLLQNTEPVHANSTKKMTVKGKMRGERQRKTKRAVLYLIRYGWESMINSHYRSDPCLKHMVLISACHGPFYSYTRPPLTPPQTPSSLLMGCGPQQINDIKMQSWIGHSPFSPPSSPLSNIFWDGFSSRFNLHVRVYREWYLCYSGLITWLADGFLDLMSGLISWGCERSWAKHPKPRQRLPVAVRRITTTWRFHFRCRDEMQSPLKIIPIKADLIGNRDHSGSRGLLVGAAFHKLSSGAHVGHKSSSLTRAVLGCN